MSSSLKKLPQHFPHVFRRIIESSAKVPTSFVCCSPPHHWVALLRSASNHPAPGWCVNREEDQLRLDGTMARPF